MRSIWRKARNIDRVMKELKDDMNEYEAIKGYHMESVQIEKYTMRYFRVMCSF